MTRLPSALLPPGLAPERIACCLGLVSDTHMPERRAALPPALFAALQGVDLVLHAGDVGELWVLDQLSTLAPVVAVHGNDDTADAQRELPYQQLVAVAGQRVLLCHTHEPDPTAERAQRAGDAWEPKLARRAAQARRAGARVLVFGHTHIPLARWHDDVLLVNPGALASPNGTTRQVRQTVALLCVTQDGAVQASHVDPGQPDRRTEPLIHWEAGFQAALRQVSATILSPELAAVWPGLVEQLRRVAPEAGRAALLRLGRRCWDGEQETIGLDDVLAELRAAADLPPEAREQLVAMLLNAERS
jgi:putative phosphoesterase